MQRVIATRPGIESTDAAPAGLVDDGAMRTEISVRSTTSPSHVWNVTVMACAAHGSTNAAVASMTLKMRRELVMTLSLSPRGAKTYQGPSTALRICATNQVRLTSAR